ncbi:alpha-L-fucosidase [uncultured Phocaeicola sp.]|uniref:alpha-L-fucosidase n=1 Tax=uncultured Phocaeicola sp. TaxID=990718 RepID=UPI0030C7077E
MKCIKFLFSVCFSITLGVAVTAQGQQVQGFVHEQSQASDYVWPTDLTVLKKIDLWQDQKFGVLFHWGLYSVPGIVESWSICSEDEDWIPRDKNVSYEDYKKWYWSLKDSLNPVNFNPEQWADVMEDAGMKYMIFTTKHHDGFCMFDSKYTDFSITHGPFKNNSRRNVALYVFEAFRKKGFMIGCYYSKPDWHCQWYWNDYYATPNRYHNYEKEQHQDWWKNYQTYTENQLNELTSDYGALDILWLDGGWVTGDDVNLDSVLEKARQKHPGLIAVDRSIRGKNENYQTPERGIPAIQLNYPWESNIPLSNDWGWGPNAPYKSSQKVVALLAEIVAKGGCFLLGVGPTPDGLIEKPVVERLHRVGEWLRVNGEAIYSTRTTPIYNDGKTWFTANKNGKTLYAIYTIEENEQIPATITWKGNIPQGRMLLLQNGKKVKYKVEGDTVIVQVPGNVRAESLVFSFNVKK